MVCIGSAAEIIGGIKAEIRRFLVHFPEFCPTFAPFGELYGQTGASRWMVEMFDPNIKDFYERVGRLKQAHAKGYAFEGVGVLGRSYYRKPQRKNRLKLLVPVMFVLMAGFGLKGSIHYFVGAQTYENRVSELQGGKGFDKLGAVLMAPDSLTLWVSNTIRKNLQKRG